MRNAFVNTIIDSVDTRDDLYIITGDAGLGVFDTFKDKHPDRFLNLGAAEQNMISFAAGLAISGFKVMIYNIIPFVLYRCYEQVRNDICYQDLPIILVGIGSGLTYSPQGMTHYSVEDIGLTQTLPNLTVFSPIDPIEARLAAEYTLKAESPSYVRLAKRGEPNIHTEVTFDITEPQMLRQGKQIALFSHGSITEEAVKAAEMLRQQGITPSVISVPLLQPINGQKLVEFMSQYELVLVVEEHYNNCGLGGIMAKLAAEHRLPCNLLQCGVPYRFIHEIHDNQGMRQKFGIDAEGLAQTVMKFLGK